MVTTHHARRRTDDADLDRRVAVETAPVDGGVGSGDSEVPHPTSSTERLAYSTSEIDCLSAVYAGETLAVDLETKGLHPHATADAAIGAVIVATADGQRFIFRELPFWWINVMEDPAITKVAHNWKFDAMWMIHVLPELSIARNLQDTMLKAQIVAKYRTQMGAAKAGRPTSYQPFDLGSVLKRHLGVTIGKTIDHDLTDWLGYWSDEMTEYMLEDIQFLLVLNTVLDKEIQQQGQEQASWIENNTVFGVAWMTYNGITPDVDAWLDATNEWEEHMLHLLNKHLKKAFPSVKNFNSPKQLMEAMPDVIGGPLVNTRKAMLSFLAPDFPQLEMLLEFRHYSTRLKNWGPHFLTKYVCMECKRFHPGWRQIGTETARFSCSAPNLQQIPRAAEFRKLFVAAPGTVLVSLDYSAIEVLVAAVQAEDAALLEACRSSDTHLATAAMMTGKAEEDVTEEERQGAKITNFGLLFAGGVDGLVGQARDIFRVTLDVKEAEKMMNKFFATFPGLRRVRNWAYKEMDRKAEVIEARNLIGFRRVLEGYNRKPTSLLNTIIQSTAGHGIKAAFPYLMEERLLPFLCLQVHDELLFEFPEEDAADFTRRAEACLVQGMRDVLGSTAPVKVKANTGTVWL